MQPKGVGRGSPHIPRVSTPPKELPPAAGLEIEASATHTGDLVGPFAEDRERVALRARGFSNALCESVLNLRRHYDHLRGQVVNVAYSGGLDTSYFALAFMREVGVRVRTVSFNVGQASADFDAVRSLSETIGAKHPDLYLGHVHVDIRDRLVENYFLPALRSRAGFTRAHPLASSLTRPAMVEALLKLELPERAVGTVFGSDPTQNNPWRFNRAVLMLDQGHQSISPHLKFATPRALIAEYLEKGGVVIFRGADRLVSRDENALGNEAEQSSLADGAYVSGSALIGVQGPESVAARSYGYRYRVQERRSRRLGASEGRGCTRASSGCAGKALRAPASAQ